MKFVFFILPEPGHVHPFLGPAQALVSLGHKVVVASPGDISGRMRQAGLEFDSALVTPGETPKGRELVALVEDRERHRAVIEKLFLAGVEEKIPHYREVLRRWKPHRVVLDPMNYAAVLASHSEGVPWASVSTSLSSVITPDIRSDVLDVVDLLARARGEVFRRNGLDRARFRAADCLSPTLNITFATEDFVGAPPAEVQLVGSSQPVHKRGDEVPLKPIPSGRPLIYISFGSQVSYYPAVFRKLREAARGMQARMIFSIGDLIDEPGWEDSADCQFYRYAPQIEILKRASLFVTHGGANSVMEALREGTPMLVSPICNDQYHQAHYISRSGVGRELDLRTASVAEIRKMLSDMLFDLELRRRAKFVSRGYVENGAWTAARLLATQ